MDPPGILPTELNSNILILYGRMIRCSLEWDGHEELTVDSLRHFNNGSPSRFAQMPPDSRYSSQLFIDDEYESNQNLVRQKEAHLFEIEQFKVTTGSNSYEIWLFLIFLLKDGSNQVYMRIGFVEAHFNMRVGFAEAHFNMRYFTQRYRMEEGRLPENLLEDIFEEKSKLNTIKLY